MIVFENVNPDRVYLMGYSAGGDGVYQLAPRMADRLAAAAMMAGHPNEARPEGLRNIGFAIHMGANDSAYNRNKVAAEWGQKLDALQAADPEGYIHETTIHPNKGHWMDRQDAVAVPWMAEFTRNAWPKKVHWVQDDIAHSRFYWLQLDLASAKAGDEIFATVSEQEIHIQTSSVATLTLLLNDRLLNLDQPITVIRPDGTKSEHRVTRTISAMATSLQQRNDPQGLASASLSVMIPPTR
jgi:pimeloyl-ACP methyl ester carboxylesterase